MGIFKHLSFGKKQSAPTEEHASHSEQNANPAPDLEALKEFCALILGGHHEDVFNRCKMYIENDDDEPGGIAQVLYVLSGQDIDPNDEFGNMADWNKQLVKPQSYLISSDAGAPCLADFFWFIEDGIKTARGLDFAIDKTKFSDDDCIVQWLAELATQLDGLFIVNFDGAGEDYHFTIMNKTDCDKAMALFAKMTAHIADYDYTASVIDADFGG